MAGTDSRHLSRRQALAAAGLGGLAAALGVSAATAPVASASSSAASATSPATARRLAAALRTTAARALSTSGTTLEVAALPLLPDTTVYSRLTAGPGWPLVVREDLVAGAAGRDDRRTGAAAFVQLTDLHVLDAESPVRFEYLHPLIGSAHRPQETLGAAGTAALVRRVNALRRGPFTGRDLDFVMTTGDNTDNHEQVELDWFLTLLSGGSVRQTTGDPDAHEGVQASGASAFWNPDRTLDASDWTAKGFPEMPGLLAAAAAEVISPGLDVPWYCTFGNHDDSIQGSIPDLPGMTAYYTGRFKVVGRDETAMRRVADRLETPGATLSASDLFGTGTLREVTPDPRRAPFSTGEFVRAHLDPAVAGAGPVGHGFTEETADGRDVYYTFEIAPGITGISLDTTTTAGFADGSIGLRQLTWLEGVLRRGSSVYWNTLGARVRHDVEDELFVLFSHHTSGSMTNVLPDRRRPLDPRLTGGALVGLLNRFPNVLAWVNGHTHANAITAHPGDRPELGFWEINTASHIDHPQLARVIEVADNADGTLSLFTTLVEADAPYAVEYDDFSAAGLASLYREIGYNDLHVNPGQLGGPADRNTELLLVNPLA